MTVLKKTKVKYLMTTKNFKNTSLKSLAKTVKAQRQKKTPYEKH